MVSISPRGARLDRGSICIWTIGSLLGGFVVMVDLWLIGWLVGWWLVAEEGEVITCCCVFFLIVFHNHSQNYRRNKVEGIYK